MAATYGNPRINGGEYRDSLRSANSASVYSTESSSYLDSSPLDSIIRDYPAVPKYPSVPYGSSLMAAESSSSRFQHPQQHPIGIETPSRLREYSPSNSQPAGTANYSAQPDSSSPPLPLLHTRFRSPTNSISPEPQDRRRPFPDAGIEDNFIDLRDSGTFSPPPATNLPSHSNYNNYAYFAHGVPPRNAHGIQPRQDHGVTPLLMFARPPVESHFSPITPDVVDPPPNPAQSKPQSRELLNAGKPATSNPTDDYFDRSSWGTQYSDTNAARQTWMTATSGVTVGDPFAFRHYETPQASANYPPNANAPTVVVHEPETHAQFSTTGAHSGPNVEEADDVADIYAFAPASPLEPPVQGRAPSKVPVASTYNFSRPLRSDKLASPPSTVLPVMPERDSEYSTTSGLTDLPHTILGFPEPPIPNPSTSTSLPPSSYAQQSLSRESDPPLTRRAIARMSIPKTIPNLVYTDDQLSPSPDVMNISSGNEFYSGHGSPSRLGQGSSSTPRSLSPIRDQSRGSSPASSPRMNGPSHSPGPHRTYEVPYSYHVTTTGQKYDEPSMKYQQSSSSHSDHSSSQHGTRYRMSGTALPPAPREVITLPSSPPPTQPRPGSSLSIYSRYSFYSVGDLPNSGNSTPLAWEKNGKPRNESGKVSPSSGKVSPSNRTPTPTNNNGGKGTAEDEYQGLPYLNNAESATAPKETTPQECLLLGISHHEANRLAESAFWFEKAANEKGGCGVGMLMWGLSLRHAWGVEKDERAAFWWLRRAAECAVADMERTKEGVSKSEDGITDVERERDRKAVQSELVLAVYEVGQCFFHGWGVDADKKMAVSYFQVAARLGDVDAQLELGFCFANGKGCKKDLKEAARWYRAAAAQGASTVGLAWIYKPKYGGSNEIENDASIDQFGKPIFPPAGSAASVKSGKSDGRRRLKKPPPRSRTPSGRSKSPTRTEFSIGGMTVDSP